MPFPNLRGEQFDMKVRMNYERANHTPHLLRSVFHPQRLMDGKGMCQAGPWRGLSSIRRYNGNDIRNEETKMHFLRLHWFDVGVALAAVVGAFLLVTHPTGLALLLWLSLITLFLHQFEEYHYPGYFPGMLNSVLFSSRQPDRYPLNAQTSLIVNVIVGWLCYFLAAVFSDKVVWLGIATILVSIGNILAHTFLFNIKGRTVYNPGMLTALVFFLPLSVFFFSWVVQHHAASTLDWIFGIILGIALNYIGVIKIVDWMKDPNTPYVFTARFLVPGQQTMPVERV
jgi:hypothetical protein